MDLEDRRAPRVQKKSRERPPPGDNNGAPGPLYDVCASTSPDLNAFLFRISRGLRLISIFVGYMLRTNFSRSVFRSSDRRRVTRYDLKL